MKVQYFSNCRKTIISKRKVWGTFMAKTLSKRYSGVLAHPTSFPSPYGIGDFGKGAYDFINFLTGAGQSLWQILPLGHTGYGDSPYQAFSAFAGQPLLISPDELSAL